MEQQTLLSIGQVVYTNLYNRGKGVIVNIHGEQKPASIQNMHGVMVTGGNAKFDIVFFNGNKTHRLPESILHGVQWQIENEILDKKTIKSLIKKSDEFEKAEKAAEEKTRNEFNQAVENQRNNNEYTHLTKITSKSDSEIKIVGKNIRADLKKHFPKTKFSVRMRHYTSYYISWEDGVTVKEVEEILKKYKTGCFDAYTDYHYSVDSPFNKVYGGVDYIFTSRDFSEQSVEKAISLLLQNNNYDFDTNTISVENYKKGKLYNIGKHQSNSNYGIQGDISNILKSTCF
ncbi:hypothetical protein GKR75_08020 [Providencia sp. wls1919]|nr:hypothetical protein [Providencia sp. wls1919]